VTARRSGPLALAATAAVVMAAASCAAPPWFLGAPLDGKPSITPGSARASVPGERLRAAREGAAGHIVLEIQALLALDEAARLTSDERARLAGLLEARAADFHAQGRPIPEERDLRLVERLTPPRAEILRAVHAAAARAAGDTWLAIGALDEATRAYQRAAALGAPDVDLRAQAAAGAPPAPETPLPELAAAIAALPLRAVPPVAYVYVAHGGNDPQTLRRGLEAARQERLAGLIARIGEALALLEPPPAPPAQPAVAPASAPAEPAPAAAPAEPAPAAAAGEPAPATAPFDQAPAVAAAPIPPPLPPRLDEWLLAGPSFSGRLLPVLAAHPELAADRSRATRWIDLALAEDATSPDVLATAALVFGRAGRFGGVERMLMELTYFTPDRAAGLARGAALWDQLGRPREACAQWIRAARWRDEAEDPTWRTAIACARRDPGAGDWRAIRQYVLDRAAPSRRAALAAALDGGGL
jgi:hypothetical protein